jgi:hypothetical protein
MQYSYASELGSEGRNTLWQTVKYPLLAAIAIVAVIEFGAGALIAVSIFAGLVVALVERVKKIDEQQHTQVSYSRLMGDGGCFPNEEPEEKATYSQPVSVLDGGSFERDLI